MLFSSVFAITEGRDTDMYEVPLSMSLLGLGMGTMLTTFHMCGVMLLLRACFKHAREECQSKRDYVSSSGFFWLFKLALGQSGHTQ